MTDRDPYTGEEVEGRYVSRTVFQRHSRADKQQELLGLPATPEAAIMAQTLLHPGPTDATVSTPYHDQQRKSIHKPPLADKTRRGVERDIDAPDLGGLTHDLERLDLNARSAVRLSTLEMQFSEKQRLFTYPNLTFHEDPKQSTDAAPRLTYTNRQGSSNMDFLTYHNWLEKLILEADAIEAHENEQLKSSRKSLVSRLQEEQSRLDGIVEEQWLRKKLELGLASSPNTSHQAFVFKTDDHFFSRLGQFALPFVNALVIVAVMHLLLGTSRESANFLLNALQDLVSVTCTWVLEAAGSSSALSRAANKLVDPASWPTDIRGIAGELDLDPQMTQFACCPRCLCTYAPTSTRDSDYPSTCTFRETPASQPCNEPLCHPKQGHTGNSKPFKRYAYQSMASWVGRLLSRPELEEYLASPMTRPVTQRMTDIWDGAAFREFKGPDGQPFFRTSDNELRLAFSLFVDWFNPHGRKRHAKSVSIGAIYMVCMNLPVHLRYRVENVYLVGIIPGPSEPSTSQMNHFLRPLVDELLQFWHTGYYFSRTANYQAGRLARAAVIPLVCDIPALRKVAGFMGHAGHTFCSFCRLQAHDIANFDVDTWPRFTWAEHFGRASDWRDALTEKDRDNLFKQNSIRWSELLRLPYWDVTKYAVLDAMHNLFLGDLRRHLVDIWKMSSAAVKTPKSMVPHSTDAQADEIEKASRAIKTKSASALYAIRLGYLIAIARLNNLEPEGRATKKDLVRRLIDWQPVEGNPLRSLAMPSPWPNPVYDLSNPEPQSSVVLHKEILEEIWSDMAKTTLPSWMARAPHNLGSPNQGRVKADHWRTACEVNLIITLIRLWGTPQASEEHKAYLDNFLALVTAVRWATMRSTSETHIQIIQDNMQQYLRSLVTLFSQRVLTPNHHLSLHLVECLRLFGPVHGWWAFPFERYNGMLGRANSNDKEGEMELSFFKSFCRGANLRSLMLQNDLTGRITQFYQRYISPPAQGTLFSDLKVLGALAVDVSADGREEAGILGDVAYQGLLALLSLESTRYCADSTPRSSSRAIPVSRQALLLGKLKVRGVSYATLKKAPRDSVILFSGGIKENNAGHIENIFLHSRSGPNGDLVQDYFLVVRPFRSLSPGDMKHDPYLKYPLLDVRLFHQEYLPTIVIKAADVISHAAICPYKEKALQGSMQVILSLCRD